MIASAAHLPMPSQLKFLDYTVNGVDMLKLNQLLDARTGHSLQTDGHGWQIRTPASNLFIEWAGGTQSENAAACISYLARQGFTLR